MRIQHLSRLAVVSSGRVAVRGLAWCMRQQKLRKTFYVASIGKLCPFNRLEWVQAPFKRSVAISGVSVHQKLPTVRIPSQFNDGSLYGRRKDDRAAGGASPHIAKRRLVANHHRQIIRMILALVLVFVVIGAAAKPEFYEPFFIAEAVDTDVENQTLSNSSDPAIVILDEIREQSVEIASTLNPQEQMHVARELIRFQSGLHDESVKAVLSELAISEDGVSEDGVKAEAMVEALIETLIGEAQQRVIDGAVWRGKDRDALRLRLMRSEQPPVSANRRPAAIVGVLSMLQQPQAFLGQPVRVLGRVARAKLISEKLSGSDSGDKDSGGEDSAKEDPLPDYWQLWLQPSRGADRPVLVLVTSVPEEIARFKEGGSFKNAPRVVVDGVFFKRLAYQSSLGADLAPVVVGRLLQSKASSASLTQRVDQSTDPTKIGPFAVIAGAIGMGVILAGLVVWRTAKSAKHTRRLRRDREVAELEVPLNFDNLPANPGLEEFHAGKFSVGQRENE